MNKKIVLFLVIMSIAFSCIGCDTYSSDTRILSTVVSTISSNNQYIVKDNQSDYRIAIRSDYSESEYFAAMELQSFVFDATGVNIPMVFSNNLQFSQSLKIISIGKTNLIAEAGLTMDFAGIKDDSFYFITKGDALFINGINERGTIFGVYELLEKFIGIRFVTNDFTYVPKVNEIKFFANKALIEPTFEVRNILTGEIYIANALFNLRMRTVHEFTPMPQKYGGSFEWYDKINTVHNSLQYVPQSKYLASNPEMFYVDADGILKDICFTNGIKDDGTIDETIEVSSIKVALESLKTFVKDADESIKYFPFEQMDWLDTCQCEKCRRMTDLYTRGGIMIRFSNILATEINKWAKEECNGREIEIVSFAYLYSEQAPVVLNDRGIFEPIDQSVIANEHLIIRLAPIFANNNYAFNDQRQIEIYKNMFLQWPLVADRFFVWQYGTDYSGYSFYYPTLQTLKANCDFFEEIGVSYYMIQSSDTEKNDWQAKMLLYVGSKMLWNSKQNVQNLQDEFLNLYYGDIGEIYVKSTMKILDDHFFMIFQTSAPDYNCFEEKMYTYLYQPLNILLTALEKLDSGLDAIQASTMSAQSKDFYSRNVKEVKLTPLYTILNNIQYYFPGDTENIKKYVQAYFQLADELGVERYTEKTGVSLLKLQFADYLR